MALPSLQIHQRIRDKAKNANIYVSDTEYSIPKSSWLTGDFYSLYRSWTIRERLYEWKSYHDCDNKSITFMAFAAMCHSKTMAARQKEGKDTVQGIAVGMIFYLINGNKKKGHAINVVHSEKGIQFFEPQNGRILNLTKKERDSIWMVII